ncbi:hypothetical protein [Microvirga massiliensis]|uniref:hypothetical protein n=1 Tax=Microvirga massiliensis TaxID=1033741 RepID=UPI00062BBB3C|nr:hypothetical protein [Microvirga massiliensis]
MNAPADVSFSGSMPVAMRRPWSNSTAASVATFPGGALSEGAAAAAPVRAVDRADPHLERLEDVRQGSLMLVMEVNLKVSH